MKRVFRVKDRVDGEFLVERLESGMVRLELYAGGSHWKADIAAADAAVMGRELLKAAEGEGVADGRDDGGDPGPWQR